MKRKLITTVILKVLAISLVLTPLHPLTSRTASAMEMLVQTSQYSLKQHKYTADSKDVTALPTYRGNALFLFPTLEQDPVFETEDLVLDRKNDPSQHEFTDDLENVTSIAAYQGNVLLDDSTAADFRCDVKKVYETEDFTRVVEFPNGFYGDLPGKPTFDFSRG